MSKKTSKGDNQLKLFVELIQNGVVLSTYEKNVNHVKKVTFGSSPRVHLNVPYGRLVTAETLIEKKDGNIHLNIPKSMHGFASVRGDIKTFSDKRTTLELFKNDYATLEVDTFKVLIRIGYARKKAKPIRSRKSEFRGSITTFFFHDSKEVFGFGMGLMLAALLTVGFVAGLNYFPFDRPSTEEELKERFRVVFISGEHFAQAPELMQENLDRIDLVKSVQTFVSNHIAMFSGKKMSEPDIALESTREAYAKEYEDIRSQRNAIEKKNTISAQNILNKKYSAVFDVPVVIAESAQGSIYRMHDKFSLMHDAAVKNLDLKKAIVPEFSDEPSYDYQGAAQNQVDPNKKGKEAIAKIHVFKKTSNEEAMYAQAEEYKQKADILQSSWFSPCEYKNCDDQNWNPLMLPSDLQGVVFTQDSKLLSKTGQDKFKWIQASEFGGTPKHGKSNKKEPIIKEPLVGEMEPSLVEKSVSQNKYQLQICYELALRRNDTARGSMEWKWRIDTRGLVSDVALISSSIKDTQMIDCVRSKMANWRFPRPRRGSVEVRYPFEFQKGRG